MAAVKVRDPGTLARAIRHVRERYAFWDEFKFGKAGPATLSVLSEVVDVLDVSDVEIASRLVDAATANPFAQSKRAWRVQADITSQLVSVLMCPGELVCVCMDDVSTPVIESFEERVRTLTNDRAGRVAVVAALTLNSEASDLLQLADLVAGGIRYQRLHSGSPKRTSPCEAPECRAYLASRIANVIQTPFPRCSTMPRGNPLAPGDAPRIS